MVTSSYIARTAIMVCIDSTEMNKLNWMNDLKHPQRWFFSVCITEIFNVQESIINFYAHVCKIKYDDEFLLASRFRVTKKALVYTRYF